MNKSQNRAAIYRRYSSDLQKPSSLVDQQRRCQRFADEHGLVLVEDYADEAAKGWNRDRDGYQAMLADAKQKKFDVLLVDDLSRLSRDSAETAQALKRLLFLRIRVIAVAEGWDSVAPGAKLTAAMKGLMNEAALDILALHTRRGQEGRIYEGLSAGGDVYGYNTEPMMLHNKVIGFRRVIDEAEADIVREVYTKYASGLSPASIADNLNARGIAGPRGGKWSRNAIYGDQQDLSGILSNPIYCGELIWNRSTFTRNPDNGRRKRDRNPPEHWVRKTVPELRIVSAELKAEVHTRMGARRMAKGEAIRAGKERANAQAGADGKYMLTGLLRCSMCGGPVSSTARDTFGCSARHNRGKDACANDVKFKRTLAEQEVLAAVRGQLFTKQAVDRFLAILVEEHSRESAASQRNVERSRAALHQAEKGIAHLLQFIESGNATPSVSARLAELEGQAQSQRDAIKQVQARPDLTKSELEALREAGSAALERLPEVLLGAPAEAREVLSRLLVEGEVVPGPDKTTVEIKMAGQLTGLLSISALKQRAKLGSVVARARFELATFGL
jgi:site-specific DNA recombinase